MLDPNRPLALPNGHSLLVFHDHESPNSFYVVPTAPSIAREDGKPVLRLLIFTKRDGNRKTISGGRLTLETKLHVPADERCTIQAIIERTIGATRPPAPGGPHAQIRVLLRDPEWSNGDVEVVLAPQLSVKGKPSMFGENRCALAGSFDTAQAEKLYEQWAARLPEGRVIYRMTLRSASVTTMGMAMRGMTSVSTPGEIAAVTEGGTVNIRITAGGVVSATFEGPLWTPELREALKEIEM